MKLPYQRQLEALKDREEPVTINRAGAPDVTGRVIEADEDGCVISTDGPRKDPERVMHIFISYRDVRGVGKLDWDYDIIAN